MMIFFKWTIIIETVPFYLRELYEIYIPFDCQFLIVNPVTATSYDILELHKVKNYTKAITNYFGNWSLDNGLNALDPFYYNRRSNMDGVVMNVYSGTAVSQL